MLLSKGIVIEASQETMDVSVSTAMDVFIVFFVFIFPVINIFLFIYNFPFKHDICFINASFFFCFLFLPQLIIICFS